MHDLIITNGTVVDGSGGTPLSADVAIDGGRISEVGESVGDAETTIDATGLIVTPGFVDPHTHLDAQLWWDASGAPSVLHGVTSAVIGSCGFGLAPSEPDAQEYLLRSLESVEEIPYSVTEQSVPFGWRTWPEFFEQLGGLDLGINVAGLVPHSTVRYAAMGDRARTDVGTVADMDRQHGLIRDALDAGALGFSTSRGTNHNDAHGLPMPSRLADIDEIAALVHACEGRVWQINIKAKGAADVQGAEAAIAEIERYAAITRASGTRLSWTPLVVAAGDAGAWRRLLDHNHELNEDTQVAPQVAAQPIVGSLCFDGPSFAALIDGWGEAWSGWPSLSDPERLARLVSPDFRAAMRAAPNDCSRITSPCYERWTVAVSPTAPETVGRTIASLADESGTHPVDMMLDLALADDLATRLSLPLSNIDTDAAATLTTDPTTLIGLGDAGAHVTSIAGYSYPTHVLATLVRDEGRMTLGDAVRRLSGHPAAVMGVPDRGLLAVGRPADVCVIDLGRLALVPPAMVHDLPGGAGRLLRRAVGYHSVVVNGEVVVRNDELTSARPGQLIRA